LLTDDRLRPVKGIRGITLTIRFLCELGLLAALAFWGFRTYDGAAAWLVGIGSPVVAAVLWGLFVAPKARSPVPIQVRLIIEFFLFGFGALALNRAGRPVLAVAFAALAFGMSVLNARQEGAAQTLG
jgi:hypothetical protein